MAGKKYSSRHGHLVRHYKFLNVNGSIRIKQIVSCSGEGDKMVLFTKELQKYRIERFMQNYIRNLGTF